MIFKSLIFFVVPFLTNCQFGTTKEPSSLVSNVRDTDDLSSLDSKIYPKVVDSLQVESKKNSKSVNKKGVKEELQVVSDRSNIFKYLPSKLSNRGDVDYTVNLQKAFNNESKIVLPNFPIAVNFNGIELQNNTTLEFQEHSQLIMLANNKEMYGLLNIRNKKNISILNPNLLGDRNTHIGNRGEWGMGINILSSANISIYNPVISNFWGDAIYLGRSKEGINYNENIKIVGGVLHNNRRNGISVISVRKLSISDILIKNTKGTAPEAGIDFEPNGNIEELQDIKLRNIKTEGNRRGILIALNHFGGRAEKNIGIQINNHVDKSSTYAIALALKAKDQTKASPIKGSVQISSASWSKNQEPVQYYELNDNNIDVVINDLVLNQQKSNISDIKSKYIKNKNIRITGK